MREDATLHAADLESIARSQFTGLTQAEERLLQSARKGEPAVCGPSSNMLDPTNDPAKADGWGHEREIRAELIRWLCLDEAARRKVGDHGIWVRGARISGILELSYTTIPFPLALEHCRLIDDAKLTYIKIPALVLNGSHTRCVLAEGAEVKGNLLLQFGFSAEGEVRLIAAQIGGTLNCEDSTFDNAGGCNDPHEEFYRGKAIRADRIKVDGGIFLRGRFKAEGEVMLNGASVGGDLSCRGGTFRNLGERANALSAENITVGGNLFLFHGFKGYGAVNLFGAKIAGSLNCTGGTFDQLIVSNASVKNMFVWSEIENPDVAQLDLRNAAAGALADDEKSWPKKGYLLLDGFEYGRISGTPTESADSFAGDPVVNSPRDAGARLIWLDRQPQFTPQPYRQLAKVLRESGDEAGAKEVLFQMKQHGRRSLLTWVWRGSAGYGVYPEWAAWELLGLIGFFTLIFWHAKRVRLMVPTEKDACASFRSAGELPSHYPRFNPLLYVIESCVPLLKLGMADRWQADPSRPAPSPSPSTRQWWSEFVERIRIHSSTYASWLRCFRWFLVIAGWLLTVLFLAAITNMLKVGQ